MFKGDLEVHKLWRYQSDWWHRRS